MIHLIRIIVLAHNRPRSLLRLLKSLEATNFNFTENNPEWKIVLDIHIDAGGGEQGRLVENVAANFRFSHGEKIISKSDQNLGVMGAWRHAWSWRDKELFIVIEDDAEMSAWWYRALSNYWRKYGDKEYIVGVGLQKMEHTVTETKYTNITDLVRYLS